MAGFNELNGVPASASDWLLDQVLRQEWNYDGFVVSDWASIWELHEHGFSESDKDSASLAINAGVEMEMASTTYIEHLQALIEEGRVDIDRIDKAVTRILSVKEELGLFENPYTNPGEFAPSGSTEGLALAYESAVKSCVLLKNENRALPLNSTQLNSIALIGPLADDPFEQMGTWVFDGDSNLSVTCKQALESALPENVQLNYCQGTERVHHASDNGFADAVQTAEQSDAVIMVVGEEAFMSGEAHCRADIGLPGFQQDFIDAIAKTGKPLVLVVMAGRPLTLDRALERADAVLYAWHLGSMAGPAIADLILGKRSPSGKLPISFPKMVGKFLFTIQRRILAVLAHQRPMFIWTRCRRARRKLLWECDPVIWMRATSLNFRLALVYLMVNFTTLISTLKNKRFVWASR